MKHLVLLAESQELNKVVQLNGLYNIATLHTELKTRLAAGLAHFMYTKKDGTVRNAFGTLRADLIPPQPEVTCGEEPGHETKPRPENPNVQKYYDFEAKAWRAFTISKLIAIF